MTQLFLVDGGWVKDHLDDTDVVLLDTRTSADYWKGHLPGARHFDAALFSHYDTSPAGLSSLVKQYATLFSLLGLGGDERVIVYESRSDSRAARAAWLLEYLGHERVSLLDGGLSLIQSQDITLTDEARPYAPRQFKPSRQDHVVASAADIQARLGQKGFRVVDTRRADEYYGQEKRAKRNGAIPGAIHRNYTENIAADGRFKPASELRAAYEALGLNSDDEIVAYCGGGARAAHTYYALKAAGFDAVKNYTGSWGEWGNREDLPIETPVRPT